MTLIYQTDDFEITTGPVPLSPPKCLHVKPGYETFQPRCKRALGHDGAHEAAVAFVGVDTIFPPEKWENTGE